MTEFKDHFSQHASAYATFRPLSPVKLFEYLVSLAPAKRVAWDVGTGNGQAALALANYFEKVIATDASAEQINNAPVHAKVIYKVMPAENACSILEEVDLITVAQAIHWFNFDAFYAEVKRVTAPQAVIAAWSYELASVEPSIDAVVKEYYDVTLKDYWPPERHWVDEGYATLPFPFKEISAPPFSMTDERNLSEWTGYLFTWSATQKAIKAVGPEIFKQVEKKLAGVWGDPLQKKRVSWPLALRVGYV